MEQNNRSDEQKMIEVCHDGPYIVTGNIPLVRKTQIVSEYGEPLSWKFDGQIETEEGYFLCRCGQSLDKPFCDGTHSKHHFEGTETAPLSTRAERQETLPGGSKLFIRFDTSLCTSAGFCANRNTSIAEMAPHTNDPTLRALAIAMVEHCPSGALTYAVEENGEDIEVDLPVQIAVTTEITSQGAIHGPLWVTGEIQIIRADGSLLERRNRVCLCNCGHSQDKPLCDGSHREYPVFKEIS